MIFLRARSNFTVPAGTLANNFWHIPNHVQAGDYCVVFACNNQAGATLSYPNWLTEIKKNTIAGVCDLYILGGWVPAGAGLPTGLEYNVTVTSGSPNNAWCWASTFWGGVHPTTPVLSATSAIYANASATATTQTQAIKILYGDAFANVGSGQGTVINLVNRTADGGGGVWAVPASLPDTSEDFRQLSYWTGTNYSGAAARTNTIIDANTANWIPELGRIDYLNGTGGSSDKNQTIETIFWLSNVIGPGSPENTDPNLYLTVMSTLLDSQYQNGVLRQGVAGRIKDKDNFILAMFIWDKAGPLGTGTPGGYVALYKFKAGVGSWMGTGRHSNLQGGAVVPYGQMRIRLTVNSSGGYEVWHTFNGNSQMLISGTDADLASGGALDYGYSGLFDTYKQKSEGITGQVYRRYDDFTVQLDQDPVNEADIFTIGGFTGNADPISITSSPSGPTGISEVMEPAGGGTGRSLVHKYIDAKAETTIPTISLQVIRGSGIENPNTRIFVCAMKAATEEKIPAVRRPSTAHKPWKFFLADGQDVTDIKDELVLAKNKQISFVLNRPGSASFQIHVDDSIAPYVEPLSTSLLCYRGDRLMWSGPIWTVEESTGGEMNVSAAGWQALLDKRLISPSDEKYVRFGKLDASAIAAHLLTVANERQVVPATTVNGVPPAGQYWIVNKALRRQARRRFYERYQSIGQELIALSDIENGLDIWIDPENQKVELWDELSENLTSTCVFSYGVGDNNIASASRQRAADRVVNGLYAITKTPGTTPSQQIEANSANTYGFLEEQISLSEATDVSVALAYAAAEFQFRSTPLPTYQLVPLPHTPDNQVPVPLADYHVGSIVSFSINRGSISISNQAARVFQLDLAIDENGAENVTNLTIFKSG